MTMSGVMSSYAGRERRIPAQIVRERFAEERRGHDDAVRPAEPLKHEIAQAPAHGVADQQRAREHRHGRGDAGDHGEVGPPVMTKAAKNQLTRSHEHDVPTAHES